MCKFAGGPFRSGFPTNPLYACYMLPVLPVRSVDRNSFCCLALILHGEEYTLWHFFHPPVISCVPHTNIPVYLILFRTFSIKLTFSLICFHFTINHEFITRCDWQTGSNGWIFLLPDNSLLSGTFICISASNIWETRNFSVYSRLFLHYNRFTWDLLISGILILSSVERRKIDNTG